MNVELALDGWQLSMFKKIDKRASKISSVRHNSLLRIGGVIDANDDLSDPEGYGIPYPGVYDEVLKLSANPNSKESRQS